MGTQQSIFPTSKQVSSPVMRQASRGRAQGSRETQTAGTNPGLLQPGFLAVWVPTAHVGHGCFTCVPGLLQGSSGRHDTMVSCTQCRGAVGLEWPSPTPSLGNRPELPMLPTRAHSSLHSPLHSQPAASQALSKSRATSQHAFLAIGASTDIPGLQVTQSKAAAPLRASLPLAQSCLGT